MPMKDTNERIIKAAITVFEKEGYEGATMNTIADEANVNPVTLFRLFQSKENVLHVAIMKNQEAIMKLIDSALNGQDCVDIESCLANLASKALVKMNKELSLMTVVVTEVRRNPNISQEVSSFLTAIVGRFEEYFGEQIKTGKMRPVNTKVAAVAVLSFLLYTTLLRKAIEGFIGDKECVDFIDIFLKGILTEKS